jgi:hypothetical protein
MHRRFEAKLEWIAGEGERRPAQRPRPLRGGSFCAP